MEIASVYFKSKLTPTFVVKLSVRKAASLADVEPLARSETKFLKSPTLGIGEIFET